MLAPKRRPQKLTGSAGLRLRAQIRIKFMLEVRRTSVTSCDPGRELSAQIKAGYKCPLPQESQETRALQHSLFPNSGQTRVPRAASFGLHLPEASLSLGPPGTKVARPCRLAPLPHPQPLTPDWSQQALAHIVTKVVSEREEAWKGGGYLDPSIGTLAETKLPGDDNGTPMAALRGGGRGSGEEKNAIEVDKLCVCEQLAS